MKIVTWNCNGALRNKIEPLSAFDADLYLIQECENPELSVNKSYKEWASNFLWRGDNKNKGIGIFAKKDITIELIDWPDNYRDNKVRHFLPCMVNNDFQLVNIWTSQNKSPNFGYIGQLWKYIELNKVNFKNIILAGDFNSNSIWDQWDRWWNHTDVVNDLSKMDIHSLYHTYFKEQQGKETRPTFFLQRNVMKPYHIDYAFASKALKTNMRQFKIGNKQKWLSYSDHLPLFFEIEDL